MAPIEPAMEHRRPVKLKEEEHGLESSDNAFYIAEMVLYLVIKVLYIVDVVNIWFLAYKRQV
jgi:hypothetical protein